MKKNISFILYDLLWCILFILSLPIIIFYKKFRTGILMRISVYPKKYKKNHDIWIHAASLGEISSIAGIISNIKKEMPDQTIIISTVTESGFIKASKEYGQVASIIFAPLDISFLVKKSLDIFKPKILLIVETEIWPNLILETKKKNIQICVVNGRITQKSMDFYSKWNSLFGPVLSSIDKYCVQSEKEKNNFLTIGIRAEKIIVCGQTKFDIKMNISSEEKQELLQNLFINEDDFLWIAGSTRPGEEEIIIDVFCELIKIKPIKLIIAPRHLDRVNEIINLIEKKELSYLKISNMNKEKVSDTNVFVLDFLGKLTSYYSIATVAFVGGTLKDFGGHNLIEPALFSHPVIFGPYINNTREIAELLINRGGGKLVKNANELKEIILEYVENKDKIKVDGEMAYEAVRECRGASLKTINEMKNLVAETAGYLL